MTELLKSIEGLAATFGPLGAVCLLIAALVGWGYRRDILAQRHLLLEAQARASAREDRLLEVAERSASSFERAAASQDGLSKAVAGSNDNLTRTMDRLADAIRDAEIARRTNLETMVGAIKSARQDAPKVRRRRP